MVFGLRRPSGRVTCIVVLFVVCFALCHFIVLCGDLFCHCESGGLRVSIKPVLIIACYCVCDWLSEVQSIVCRVCIISCVLLSKVKVKGCASIGKWTSRFTELFIQFIRPKSRGDGDQVNQLQVF